MIWAIILTFVITTLSMLVMFQGECGKRQRDEICRLREENDGLQCQISDYYNQNHRRREKAAYNRGLHDGRETDGLYRSIIRKYSAGDQVTVMMKGEMSDE